MSPNGKVYDMSDNHQREKLADECTIFYHNRLVDAIKKFDNELLVSEGFFTINAVSERPDGLYPNGMRWDHRYPPTFPVLARTELDFIDMHSYRGDRLTSISQHIENDLKSMNFYDKATQEMLKEKPIIMGEFGSWKNVDLSVGSAAESVDKMRNYVLKKGFEGYLYWTFDTFSQSERLYNMMSGDREILKKISNVDLNK